MDRVERPLSPHLQVYRPQITSVLSIVHRATGVTLSLGVLLLAYWLVCAASGEQAYDRAHRLLSSGWIKVLYAGLAFCFFYHLANGVRHLFWDLGLGLEPEQYKASGWAVIVFAAAATAAYSLLVIV